MHTDSQYHLALSLGSAHDQLGEETRFFDFFKLSDSLFGYIFFFYLKLVARVKSNGTHEKMREDKASIKRNT